METRSIKVLAKDYADTSGSGRQKIVNEEIPEHDLDDLQAAVKGYYGKKVAIEHKDKKFLSKLVSWAVVESSKMLDKDAMMALDRHRKTHLEKGPDLDVGKVDEESGKTKDKEKGMKTVSKKGKAAPEKKAEKKVDKKKSTEGSVFNTRAGGPVFPDTILTLKGKNPLTGQRTQLGDLLKKGLKAKAFIESVQKLKTAKKVTIPHDATGISQGVIRRLEKADALTKKEAGKSK